MRKMKMIKALFLSGLVLSILSWTVAVAGEHLLIVRILDRQPNSEEGIILEKLEWTVGSPPTSRYKEKRRSLDDAYELQVLDSQGKIIYTQPFDFTRYLEVPLPEPGQYKQDAPSRTALKEPEAVLVVPYFPEGVEIRVKGKNKKSLIRPIPTPSMPKINNSQESIRPAPLNEGNFNILLIASGFSSMTNFQATGTNVREFLLSKEPFVSQRKNVVVSTYENSSDLGCYSGCYNIDRLMCCDSTKVVSAALASGKLYDEIVVIHNTSTYSGGGFRDLGTYQTDSSSSYCMVYNGKFTTPMLLHELGHSFGNLCDEYTYGSGQYDYSDCANCRPTCSDWSGISATCQLGCDARNNYYRPADSIMLTLDIPYYNQPSIHNSLIPRLDYFVSRTNTSEMILPALNLLLLLQDDN